MSLSHSLALSLLKTAFELAHLHKTKPRQSDLKRAVSTAYYALFHAFACNAADCLIGSTMTNRSQKAWTQTYRAIGHIDAQKACNKVITGNLGFPIGLKDASSAFIKLQKIRHEVDYNPNHCISQHQAYALIKLAEVSIQDLLGCDLKDRRAFAAFLLLRQRS